jgi:tetratricopeptide (TPR) repeat protein
MLFSRITKDEIPHTCYQVIEILHPVIKALNENTAIPTDILTNFHKIAIFPPASPKVVRDLFLQQLQQTFEQARGIWDTRLKEFEQAGKRAYEEQRYPEAIVYFDAMVHLNPRSPHALYLRGQTYEKSNLIDLAFTSFEAASKLAPKNQTIRNARERTRPKQKS